MRYIFNVKNKSLMILKDNNPYQVKANEYPITEEQARQIEANRDMNMNITRQADGTLSFAFVSKNTPEDVKELERMNKLRAKRRVLLAAFDKWEKAVLRGREVDDKNVMSWYTMLLNLVEYAFETSNIPERIKYYL